MRKGYRITLSILTIMIMMTLTVGTSYSYYSISSEQENPNQLVTTCFDITFNDENGSTAINLSGAGKYAYPMTEATALSKLTPYSFTITNNCTTNNATVGVNYVLTLNTLVNPTSTLTNNIRYKLNATTPTAIEGTSAMLADTPYQLPDPIKTEHGIVDSYSLDVGTLGIGESKTFNLYLWIDELAGNDIMNQNFNGKLLVYSYM